MVSVTKLNGKEIILNSDLIETMESLPDTTITMTTGKKVIVTESIDEVIERIITYKNKIFTKHN